VNLENPGELIKSIEEFTPLETTGQPVKIKMSLTGFTLTELLIGLVITAILAAIALPKFGRVMERSRQTEAITILGAMRGAQIRYYIDNNNSYTTNAANLDIELSAGEFFNYTLPASPNDSSLALATRNGVSQTSGSAGYRLEINRNGVISCDSGTCVDIP
jgi:type IV pilus assembly protein PilE